MKRTAALLVSCVLTVSLAGAADDQLARAQQRASALNFVNSLGITVPQAQAMVRPLQRIQVIVQQAEQAREAAAGGGEAITATQQARVLLLADREVSEATLARVRQIAQELDLVQRGLYVSVDAAMQDIADILSPAQNAGLDWRAPAAVRSGPTAQQRAQLQREIDARVRDGATMLDRVKYLDAFNFVTGRMPIIQEYLTVNQDPGRALPENAVEICLYWTDQARLVPVEEWRQRAPGMAAQMVSQLGLMPTLDPGPKPGAVSWWTLYQLVTAPETLAVMQEIPQRRRN